MSYDIPTWAAGLAGPLARAFEEVWQQLPEYARIFLDTAKIPVREMTPTEAHQYPADMCGALKYTPGATPAMEILIRPALVLSHLRFALAHEFAHLVLQHHLRGPMGLRLKPQPAQFLGELEDECATFLQVTQWGQWDDFCAVGRGQSGPGPRWLESYTGGNHAGRQNLAVN